MNPYEWLVIGAGPAGIVAVGKLLDANIHPKQICWIDPQFTVGDLGTKWTNVPGNTKVSLFLRTLTASASFGDTLEFPIHKFDPNETCLLQHVVGPLQTITHRLKDQVDSVKGEALALCLTNSCWEIALNHTTLYAHNVILATGADPKTLDHSFLDTIPLEIALNPTLLAQAISTHDRVAVFGSSHSAVLAMANLCSLPVQSVVNFYRSPHRYAVYLDDWILFDDSGLKGYAANWARKHLDGISPRQLTRHYCYDSNVEESMRTCNKAVYAVGFETRKHPVLVQYPCARYNESTGIIAPGLFGLGIGYPQVQNDRLGNRSVRIGLWKFMSYLSEMLPIWMKCGKATI